MTSTQVPRTSARRPRVKPELGVVDGLVQTHFLVQKILGDVGSDHDLSIIQIRLLGVLSDREPRMAQLADLLELTKQSTTGLVDRAERRGLVRRVSIPVGDERAVHVSLTESGRGLAIKLHREVASRVASLAADLSESNRTKLSGLLSQLVAQDAERRGVNLDPANQRPVR